MEKKFYPHISFKFRQWYDPMSLFSPYKNSFLYIWGLEWWSNRTERRQKKEWEKQIANDYDDDDEEIKQQ